MIRDPRRLGLAGLSLAGMLLAAWLGFFGVAFARLFIIEECVFDGGGHCDSALGTKVLLVAYQLLLVGSAAAFLYAGYRGFVRALTLRPVHRAGLAAVVGAALLIAWLAPIVILSL